MFKIQTRKKNELKSAFMPSVVAIATRRIDDPLPTNVQHLMTRLASHFLVFYIEPPADFLFLLRNPKFLMRFFRKRDSGLLKKLTPIIFPFGNRLHWIKKINQKIFLVQTRLFIKQNTHRPYVLWLFSPKDFYTIKHLCGKLLYFHITDDYTAFPGKAGLGSRSQVLSQEYCIITKANRVFVTSKYLANAKSQWLSKITLIPNVADSKHFEKAKFSSLPIPPDIACINKPIVGFIGAIDYYKVDFDLIHYCAKENPKISFVLVGPVGKGDNTALDSLPQEDNIHYLGEKPYSQLPNYIKAFNVCLIPYRITNYTKACFPLKLFEYLAAGKPVVSTNLPAVYDHHDIILIGEDPQDFNRLIRRALHEDSPEMVKARQRIAKISSWDQRIEGIKNIIIKDVEKCCSAISLTK